MGDTTFFLRKVKLVDRKQAVSHDLARLIRCCILCMNLYDNKIIYNYTSII